MTLGHPSVRHFSASVTRYLFAADALRARPKTGGILRAFCLAMMIAAAPGAGAQVLADRPASEERLADELLPAGFEPAVFSSERSLEKYVVFPDGEADIDLTVPCEALAGSSGRMSVANCYLFRGDTGVLPFIHAINIALRRTRARPARVAGNRLTVVMHFSVRFQRAAGTEKITVELNHGANVALYGDSYIDPQPYWWPPLRITPCISSRQLSWTVSLVGDDGIPIRTDVLPDLMSEPCAKTIETYLMQTRYIPAHHEGKRVDAYFGNPMFRR